MENVKDLKNIIEFFSTNSNFINLLTMPLYQLYVDQMKDCPIADLDNLGSASPAGGACTAAGFLSEFVENENWAHVDIAGVMANSKHVGYINAGMSGRPARTFLRYIEERLTNSD